MVALKVRDDVSADALRRWARCEARGRPAARAYAIANALEGMSRAAAARAAGMERQALRDAVVRYNGEGVVGLYDRAKGHPPPRLTAAERAALAEVVERGPDPELDGVSAWTRADLCRWLETSFSKTYHPSSMSRVLRSLGMSRQKIRPSHPEKDAEAEEDFKKGGSARR
jgi:transposase